MFALVQTIATFQTEAEAVESGDVGAVIVLLV